MMTNPNQKEALFSVIEDNCKLCYACVRVCPARAIEIKANLDTANILDQRCIGCGSCLQVCPHYAIVYRNDESRLQALLQKDNKKIALVDPSISGEFPDITDYRNFVGMIKTLGFDYVLDASFGADLVAIKYKELLSNFKGKYFITSKCPAVVFYVQKYFPELIENLAPIDTPMAAAAKVARERYGENNSIVYIGACIANKDELSQFLPENLIDCVLSFQELRHLFKKNSITENKVEYSEFDPPIGRKGALFPLRQGMLQSVEMYEDLENGDFISINGSNNMQDLMKEFSSSYEIRKHIDIFYCDGCIMGPGTTPNGKKFQRQTQVSEYVKKRLANIDMDAWEKEIETYLTLDLSRSFKNDDQRLPVPNEEKVAEILKMIRQEGINSEIGCGSCGYESCRDFAIAVTQGLAKPEMCLNFSLTNWKDYIKTLKATNEKLAKTQDALKLSEKKAKKDQEIAIEMSETTTAMLQKLPSGVVIVNEKLKVKQANQTFIDTLGEDARSINEIIPGLEGADLKSLVPFNIYSLFSYVHNNNENIINRDIHFEENLLNISIFVIKKGKTYGAVFRDMQSPDVRKEEIIKRVSEVIEKNLEMVQKIGFLLGEGASETEKMLNTIIETYKSSDKKRS